jgi:AraC-like DNA-binding protein
VEDERQMDGVGAAMVLLLNAVARQLARESTRVQPSVEQWRRVELTRELFGQRYMHAVPVSQIASELRASPYHLNRVFRSCTGMTLHGYLTELRLRAAWHELRDWPGHLSGLASLLGFSSHSHFAAAFRRSTGMTPSEARDPELRVSHLIRAALYVRRQQCSQL